MSIPPSDGLELRLLPDSPDARLFVELSSYTADLIEAKSALELALASIGGDGPLSNAHAFLTGFAAVAYCRTYFSSNVRTPMTERVSIPDEPADVHIHITEYRNRRVAHTQSHLSSTFAFVGIDADGIRPGIIAATASAEIPAAILERWMTLIDVLIQRVGALQAEVETRILETVVRTDLGQVRTWRSRPDIVEQPASAFTARLSRGRYPTEWTVYWGTGE